VDNGLVIARLIHFAGAMAAFGGAAFTLYAVDRGIDTLEASAVARFDRWDAGLLRVSALVMLVSGLAILPFVAGRMAGVESAAFDPGTIGVVLSDTAFGRVWCWHLLFTVLLILSAAIAAHRRALNLVWAALALVSLGWVGHAAGGSGWTGLGRELNQSVHLLAAGLWLGGLLPLGWLLGRARSDEARFAALAGQALPAFSHMGYAAVAVIAITGTVNTLLLAGNLDALFGTDYGRLLSLKILLYLAMVAIALRNRFRLMPRLSNACPSEARALQRSVLVEQAIGLAILTAVSFLGSWPPPVPHHH
jgi:putative copper resistance protein D